MVKNRNIILLLWAMLVTGLLATACKTESPIPDFNNHNVHEVIDKATTSIGDASGKVENSSDAIKSEAVTIKEEANQASDKLTPDVKTEIQPHLTRIIESASSIEGHTGLLDEALVLLVMADSHLKEASIRVRKIEEEAKKAYAARVQAEKERDEALQREKEATGKMIRWLIIICIIGVGLAVPVGMFGSPYIGIMLGAASVGTLVVAITVSQYFDYIAIGGLVIIGLAAVMIAYKLFVRDKAVKEIVQTTEMAKEGMGVRERRRIFGHRASPGLAYQMQSSSTENLVSKVRHKMKGMWEETIAGTRGHDRDSDPLGSLS